MSIIKVLVIPADKDKPVREDSYDSADYKNLTALIFDGDRDGTFDRMSTESDTGEEATFWFDDNGLERLASEELPDIINLRAMQLYAFLGGFGIEVSAVTKFAVPLIGDYVLTGGADEEGESLGYPEWIKDFPFEWHTRLAVQKRPE